MDVVRQDSTNRLLVSARIELNERKFRGNHEPPDTSEPLKITCGWLGQLSGTAARQVSFTMSQTSRIHPPSVDHQLESRMREIRLSGSEGGGALTGSPYPYRGFCLRTNHDPLIRASRTFSPSFAEGEGLVAQRSLLIGALP